MGVKSDKLSIFNEYSLYCITCEKLSLGRSNIDVVKSMLDAGVKIIQYREKNKTLKEKLKECEVIRELTKRYGCVFIINDNIEIAKMVEADGVHIGQDDYPIDVVRRFLGDEYIIGVSTHSRQQLIEAQKNGADYVGVGPIYRTFTKEDVCEPVGYEYLEIAKREHTIPFVTIGGIKEDNMDEVLKRGAKCIAMVSEIVGCQDIQGKIRSINKNLLDWRNLYENNHGKC